MDLFHGGIPIILSSSQHPHLYLLMTATLFIRTCITSSLYRGVERINIPKPSGSLLWPCTGRSRARPTLILLPWSPNNRLKLTIPEMPVRFSGPGVNHTLGQPFSSVPLARKDINTHTFIASVIQGGCCGDRCWLMSNSSCSFAHRNICPGPPPTMIGDGVCNVGGREGGGGGRGWGRGSEGRLGGAGMIGFGADDPRRFDDVDLA